MIESRGVFKAVPLGVHLDPAKLEYILDRLVEHETEWSDFQRGRRELASYQLMKHYLPNPTSFIFEVWRMDAGAELCGLIGFTNILPQVDAQLHPIFFDGKLRNAMGKRDLLLRSMDWAFRTYDLHRLSLQIPETSHALVDFARMKLGFHFEGEGRIIKQRRAVVPGRWRSRSWLKITPTAREAEMGSRLYQALYKHGEWRDVLLLSLTRDEFTDYVRREGTWATSSNAEPLSKPSPVTSPEADKTS